MKARLWLGLLLLPCAALWIAPLAAPLTLDETVTHWLAAGSLGETIARSVTYQMSPVYFPQAWLALRGGPLPLEVALRMPSILAMTACAVALFFVARRLYGVEGALFTCVLFASSEWVAFMASDARHYGTSLFLLTLSVLFHLRWVGRGRLADGIASAIVAALAVYAHLLLGAAMLLVHATGIAVHRRVLARQSLAVAGVAAVCLLPSIPLFLSSFGRRHELDYLRGWSRSWEILDYLVPHSIALAFVGLVLGLAVAFARSRPRLPGPVRAQLPTLLAWLLAAPLLLLVGSAVSGTHVFVTRYTASSLPAVALLLAALASPLGPAWRVAIATAAVALSFWSGFDDRHFPLFEYGPEVAATLARADVSDTTPVFYSTGLVEGDSIEWLTNPEKHGYVLAPAFSYPVPGRLQAVAMHLDAPSMARVEQILAESSDQPAIYLVGLLGRNFVQWFANRLRDRFDVRALSRRVVVFQRRPEAAVDPVGEPTR